MSYVSTLQERLESLTQTTEELEKSRIALVKQALTRVGHHSVDTLVALNNSDMALREAHSLIAEYSLLLDLLVAHPEIEDVVVEVCGPIEPDNKPHFSKLD